MRTSTVTFERIQYYKDFIGMRSRGIFVLEPGSSLRAEKNTDETMPVDRVASVEVDKADPMYACFNVNLCPTLRAHNRPILKNGLVPLIVGSL